MTIIFSFTFKTFFNPLPLPLTLKWQVAGEVNTTISTVYVLAQALKIEVSELFKFE